tara:strand:+ start:6044 stop:7999 length:1956 start_codon:yes stop_codon:yes gene_type:complete
MTTHTEMPSDFYDRVSETCRLILARDTENAFATLDKLMREQPNAPEVFYLVGLAAVTMEEYGRALMFIEEAHVLDPDCFEYSDVLANLHVRVGNLTEGVYFAKLSTTLEPHPHVHNLMPSDMKNFFESLENTSIPRHQAFGFVSLHRHQYADAAREFDRQILLTPDDDIAYCYGSRAHQMLGNVDRAVTYAQLATKLGPDKTANHFQAGSLSQAIGASKPALYHFMKVAELDEETPQNIAAIFARSMQLPDADAESLSKIEDALAARLSTADTLPSEASPSRRRKERIHVGYVTNCDWNADTVAILDPILSLHDRDHFNVHIYQQTQGRNAFIQHLNNLADSERRLWELNDEIASIIIAGDEIDILVNMCTPEPDNRASLFAMQPSTIQVGYIGMNFGLKMPGITHVLSDPMSDDAIRTQAGADQDVHQIQPGLWGLKPSNMLPETSVLPAKSNGHLTFGAPCDLSALTPSAVDLLSKVLRDFPESRLVFGAAGKTDSFVSRQISQLFQEKGMEDRVSIWPHNGVGEPWVPDPAFWHNIDIFLVLDALTTPLRAADSLWMGVPVVTLQGSRPLTCTASSILASANMTEWIGKTAQHIDTILTTLTGDLDALVEVRAGLRDKLRRSALFNPVVHVRAMEDLYKSLVAARKSD